MFGIKKWITTFLLIKLCNCWAFALQYVYLIKCLEKQNMSSHITLVGVDFECSPSLAIGLRQYLKN